MALGNLGDLEEITVTPGRPHAKALFQQAIESSQKHYNNHHVYPYTYMGGYCYRRGSFKEAIKHWSLGAQVLSK